MCYKEDWAGQILQSGNSFSRLQIWIKVSLASYIINLGIIEEFFYNFIRKLKIVSVLLVTNKIDFGKT